MIMQGEKWMNSSRLRFLGGKPKVLDGEPSKWRTLAKGLLGRLGIPGRPENKIHWSGNDAPRGKCNFPWLPKF
jgi:hypothetical protein